MDIRPLGNRVLIERDRPKSESEAVITPDAYQKAPLQGVVLAVGPEVRDVIVGNRVLFPRHAGTEVQLDGVKVLIMPEDDVQAVLE